MVKKAVQQGRSKRGGEAYFEPYVEPLSDARTPLADFFSILLKNRHIIVTASQVVKVITRPYNPQGVSRSAEC